MVLAHQQKIVLKHIKANHAQAFKLYTYTAIPGGPGNGGKLNVAPLLPSDGSRWMWRFLPTGAIVLLRQGTWRGVRVRWLGLASSGMAAWLRRQRSAEVEVAKSCARVAIQGQDEKRQAG
uniref:Uncharacterized protein n=1 Tax=Oryza rufipogon TaxID=4529 RepID=A0A0E0P910_ORYRU